MDKLIGLVGIIIFLAALSSGEIWAIVVAIVIGLAILIPIILAFLPNKKNENSHSSSPSPFPSSSASSSSSLYKQHSQRANPPDVIERGTRQTAKTAPPITSREQERQTNRATPKNARWLKPGEVVKIGKYEFSSGMVYVGSDLPPVAYWADNEPALINPALSVASNSPDYSCQEMNYWPSYSEIHPRSRAAYLEWLSAGRNGKQFGIGHVFLFFYGLERRVLFDGLNAEVSDEELVLIRDEVKRLLDLYGGNNSFSQYARNFLAFINVVEHYPGTYSATPIEQRPGRDMPIDIAIPLAEMARDGIPLNAEWAYYWYMHSPEFYPRTIHERCTLEFKELFIRRYTTKFPDGLQVPTTNTPQRLEYKPASASFSSYEFPNTKDLLQVSTGKRFLNKLYSIGDSCADDLDSLSRWRGRNPEKLISLEALSVLPNELMTETTSPILDDFKNWISGILKDGESAIVSTQSVIDKWKTDKPDRMSKKESISFIQLIEKFGLGISPDVRFDGASLKTPGKCVLFKQGDKAPSEPTKEYLHSATMVRLAALIAAADGSVDQSEEDHIFDHLNANKDLTSSERIRLRASWKWAATQGKSTAGIKKKLEKLTVKQANQVCDIILGVAAADGVIDPGEVTMLQKIYAMMGLEESRVFSDLHALQGETKMVASSGTQASSRRIEKPAQKPNEAIIVDLALVKKKMEETAAVSDILSDIFQEDDDDTPSSNISSEDLTEEFANGILDPSHSALLLKFRDRNEISRDEFDEHAQKLGLLPDGAVEKLNDVAFDVCGEPILEGEDPLEINPDALEAMIA